MPLLRRPARLPDEVRARLGIGSARAVLAAGRLVDGWGAATRSGLHLVTGDHTLTRPWTDALGASLDPDSLTVTITWVDGARPTVLHLADDSFALPRALHDRIQSSVVLTTAVPLAAGGDVRVVLRCGGSGELFTQVIGDGTVDLADPSVAAAVDEAEARLRESAGL